MTYFHIPNDIERDKEGNPIKPNPLFVYQDKKGGFFDLEKKDICIHRKKKCPLKIRGHLSSSTTTGAAE